MTSNGTIHGFSVEARARKNQPVQLGDQVFGESWRRVYFKESPIGVPRGDRWMGSLLELVNLYGYASAQALRWWFVASSTEFFSAPIETRIVKHKMVYSYEVSEETEVVDGDTPEP